MQHISNHYPPPPIIPTITPFKIQARTSLNSSFCHIQISQQHYNAKKLEYQVLVDTLEDVGWYVTWFTILMVGIWGGICTDIVTKLFKEC